MPRTARQKARARKARQQRRKQAQALPRVDGELPYGHARCAGCNVPTSTIYLSSRGYCPACVDIEAIKTDHAGGLDHYQEGSRREKDRGEDYAMVEWSEGSLPTAQNHPKVGHGVGPPHYLDMTPMRLGELDLRKGIAMPR